MNPIILDERLSAAAKMAREALEGQEQPKGADIGCDHSVDRVVAATADADYLQADAAVHCLVQFKTHFQVLLHVWSNFKNKQN